VCASLALAGATERANQPAKSTGADDRCEAARIGSTLRGAFRLRQLRLRADECGAKVLVRAGINVPRLGSHLFRHSLATHLLRAGASLTDIGQVLRHQTQDATRIYAKVDITALRTISRNLALEWAMQPANRRATWSLRLADVRGFAQYLCGIDPRNVCVSVALQSRTADRPMRTVLGFD
jgi:hypothetical protein